MLALWILAASYPTAAYCGLGLIPGMALVIFARRHRALQTVGWIITILSAAIFGLWLIAGGYNP